ncbi:glutamyl-tRNA reductase [Halopenitus persicus]|uniref:Glutamyl-tRNA reductase n=1 Tax=Halopenitus persicus TaxID=1048396 RepID=A0A1H3EEL7_9EURY|nr:glutamyl-tRNA reductase [Halopenitus persicus]QHS17528.1 glutamyl-tRNA reductase [haloarchaeon 3A1-DGR]SDX77067.1 glutamyl-tRNA reductase [Halopenitus persicus]
MNQTGVLTGISVSHASASIDEIESAGTESVRGTVSDLLARPGVEEAFAIRTCNRSEAYVVTDHVTRGYDALESFAPDVRDGAIRRLDHEGSLRHLMRVAAGLESLVLGEDQIIGQVREAFEAARAAGGIGPVLEDAVTKAIHVGERARTETAINEGVVSLGSAAVDLADRRLDLADATALVVGAGEMSTLAARALDDTDVSRIHVANRTVPHAEHVAAEVDTEATALPLADLARVLPRADLLVTATGSPEPIVDPTDLADAGKTVCIDIARPRDVDPAAESVDGVTLYDIDALESVTSRTREQREAEAQAVEGMIDEELDRLLESFKRRRADDAIATMYESADRVKARELEEAFAKLDAQGGLNEDQRETVEALADALVGQLLAAPTKSLREAAGEDDLTTIQTAMRLFDPEFDAPVPRGAGADETRSPNTGGSPEGPSDGVPNEASD